MLGFLIRCLVTALGLWVASATLRGVHSTGFLSLLGAGLVLLALDLLLGATWLRRYP